MKQPKELSRYLIVAGGVAHRTLCAIMKRAGLVPQNLERAVRTPSLEPEI